MPLPFSSATCLYIFIVALVVNSWAMPLMNANDGTETIPDAIVVYHQGNLELEDPKEQENTFLKVSKFLKAGHLIVNLPSSKCLAVIFDSRTLNPLKHPMGRLLLLDEPRPTFGTNDGANQWVASKYICDGEQRDLYFSEMKWLLFLFRDVPKELGQEEKEVQKVLEQKKAEIVRAEGMTYWGWAD